MNSPAINQPRKLDLQLSSFVLHVLAMIFMLCDHLWGTFLPAHDWLTYVGRLTFPIFAFLLVEGFYHTSSLKKYALRLFLFAVISEIPFNLMMSRRFFDPLHQNVLWTFLLSLAVLAIFQKLNTKHIVLRVIFYPVTILVFYLLGILTFVDYYGYGILMVVLFCLTRQRNGNSMPEKVLRMALQVVGMYWINCEMMKGLMIPVTLLGNTFEIYQQGFALFSLPLIWLYNGKQGPHNKAIQYFCYLFYPVHIFILGISLYLR